MALVDDHQVIVTPVYSFQIEVIAATMFTREVGVVEYIVVQPVFRQRVVDIVLPIGIPVLKEFLGTKH